MAKEPRKVVYLARHKSAKDELLENILQEHGDALRGFLYVRLSHHPDCDDIIQEVFLRLSRMEDLADKLSGDTGNTRSYLFSIATNLIVDRGRYASRRKSGWHDSYNDEATQSQQPGPESQAATEEQMERALSLLKSMDKKYREPFVLNRFKFKSYRKIAAETGLSESTVERHIATALSILRKGLKS